MWNYNLFVEKIKIVLIFGYHTVLYSEFFDLYLLCLDFHCQIMICSVILRQLLYLQNKSDVNIIKTLLRSLKA